MANNIEHQDNGELVANCDQLQNDEVIVTTPVESRIMSIRGKQIMIDRDLAELYGVETRVLNQAVKRNMERFPERFRFQLTKEEMNELVTNCDRFNSLKHSTVRSYAFTEQGVAMLSTVLRSETAIRISIRIMDAFVAIRRFIADSLLRSDITKLCAMFRKYGKDSLLLAVLAYNVGPYKILGNKRFPKSHLLQKIERGLRDIEKDYLDFCRWRGKCIPSIKRRRMTELQLLYIP